MKTLNSFHGVLAHIMWLSNYQWPICLDQVSFPSIQDFILFLFFLLNLLGVTLVDKITQVSGAQFHNTSSVPRTVCSPPQVTSPSITVYPRMPSSPPPALAISTLLSVSSSSSLFLFCPIPPPPPTQSPSSFISSVLLLRPGCRWHLHIWGKRHWTWWPEGNLNNPWLCDLLSKPDKLLQHRSLWTSGFGEIGFNQQNCS